MSSKLSQLTHKIIKDILYIPPSTGAICSSIIKEELEKDKPSMIARFGSVEIKAVLYPRSPRILQTIFEKRVFNTMHINAGFFPSNEKTIRQFSELMYEDMKLLDVLGCWRIEERFLQNHFPLAKRVELKALEPYLQDNPWSAVLENKKVLVIHPFNTTIENQYKTNREFLFSNKQVLPQFKSLETIKAVQTVAGNDTEFQNWFEALDYMKTEINKKDFDIAIIGCGAYGFPLAAHVKRMGKKAVHLGGPTQMLFGIKGKRWIENDNFATIINDYFVFPDDKDKIQNALKVEDGCYW